ncbi:hypothetical protein OYC16_24340, partial [Escherichia coli]|nr:hypothetical protein [Escherichia coli]
MKNRISLKAASILQKMAVCVFVMNTFYMFRVHNPRQGDILKIREGANKRGNSSRLTQSFHFFMFEPIFSPVNALNQPI